MTQDPAQVLTEDKTTDNVPHTLQKSAAQGGKVSIERLTPRYPAWPSSQPGPRSTPPPPGMKPINALRREQVEEIGYNQETGEPGVERTPAATGQQMLGKRKKRLS
jgi:hypothetical protein